MSELLHTVIIIILGVLAVGTLFACWCLVAIGKDDREWREREEQKMAAEKNFENKVKQFLKENGCWCLKYWGGAAYTKSGIPDLLICCKGRFMGVELKAEHGTPSELQIYNLRQIDQAGGLAILLYPKDYDMFKRLMNDPDNDELYEVLKSRWKHFENINKKGDLDYAEH